MKPIYAFGPALPGYKRRLTLLGGVMFISLLLVLLTPRSTFAMSADVLIQLTNQQRQAQGLAPLQESAALTASAIAKANDMFVHNYWSHVSPSGVQPWFFMQQNHYPYIAAGENLAKDFQSESAVVAAWMNSPLHRQNILNPAYKDIGIAAEEGQLLGATTILIVAHYGATAAAQPVVQTTPAPPAAPISQAEAHVFSASQPPQSSQRPPVTTTKHIALVHTVKKTDSPTVQTKKAPSFMTVLLNWYSKLSNVSGLYVAGVKKVTKG